MATRITISSTGFTTPPDLQQSDLVFWFNDDTRPHFPVPGAGALFVAKGQTSEPFAVMPDPELPLTIEYKCARHPNEIGRMVVGGSATPPVVIGVKREIVIGPGGTFAEIDVLQPDSVFWRNDDTQDHWPVPNCFGLLVQPGASSNALQPAPAPNAPLAIVYGCAIEGHEHERGTINIFGILAAVTQPVKLSATASTAAIATGGMSPYVLRPDPRYDQLLVLSETPPTGVSISIVAGQTIPPGTADYALDVTDAFGATLQQPVTLEFS